MASHFEHDQDLEPPPSAQPVICASYTKVRSRGTIGSRPAARKHGDVGQSSSGEATHHLLSPSSHAVTSDPAEQHASSKTQSGHRAHRPAATSCLPPSSVSSSEKPNAHNGKAQPHHSASSSVVAAAPPIRTLFDPWNSSSTGHQRAENRLSGSTSWRDSRNLKLGAQFKGGLSGGGKRVFDTVGAGSKDLGKDGRRENGGWEKGAKGLRKGGQKSLAEVWGASKAGKKSSQEEKEENVEEYRGVSVLSDAFGESGQDEDINLDYSCSLLKPSPEPRQKQIFEGLCFYLNGSTMPLVSDHKLKHMLAAHGASASIALGRRTVTHVILGTTSGQGGSGGGLAASKIQKEIARTRGEGVKFITVEWVLESVKAGRRLLESRFSPLKLAPKNQNSINGMFRSTTPKQDVG